MQIMRINPNAFCRLAWVYARAILKFPRGVRG